MRKQGGHDDGGGGARTGAFLVGVGLVAGAVGGIAAATGVGAPAAPFFFGAAAALIVAGGVIYLGSSGCFVQGTMVATADGFVPIERIQAGDEVYTVDLDEGKLGINKVVKTFRSWRNEIVELGLGDETIACTPQHRFYSEGWVAAAELNPGDRLATRESQHVVLRAVRTKRKLQFVYNFTVEGPHNYLVGKSELLVHNLKKGDPSDKPDDEDP